MLFNKFFRLLIRPLVAKI